MIPPSELNEIEFLAAPPCVPWSLALMLLAAHTLESGALRKNAPSGEALAHLLPDSENHNAESPV
jgi:hypothetical protein